MAMAAVELRRMTKTLSFKWAYRNANRYLEGPQAREYADDGVDPSVGGGPASGPDASGTCQVSATTPRGSR